MTYEVYTYIFYGSVILAAVMLIVSVALFFALKIPTVIGDLTGATERKAIKNIRSHKESGEPMNMGAVGRGSLTAKITSTGSLKRNTGPLGANMHTQKISTQRLSTEAEETMVLSAMAEETAVLSQEGSAQTTLLSPDNAGATSVLDGGMYTPVQPQMANAECVCFRSNGPFVPSESDMGQQLTAGSVWFAVEYEITCIHTEEVIA